MIQYCGCDLRGDSIISLFSPWSGPIVAR